MTYEKRTGTYTLSTGRRFHAHNGVVGLDGQYAEGRYFCEGCDGYVPMDGWADDDDPPEQALHGAPWTQAERHELADEMIRRWTVFRSAT